MRSGRDVGVDWVLADVTGWLPPVAAFDLVCVLYLQIPAGERRLVLDRAADALAPGGTMLVLGHDLSNLTEGHGGPDLGGVLYTPDDLVADLAGLAVERAERVIRSVEDEDGLYEAIDALVRARGLTSRARRRRPPSGGRAAARARGRSRAAESPHPRAAVLGIARRIDGRRLERVEALGKNLLLTFEGDLVLRSHLRMKGRWHVREAGAAVAGLPWLVLRGERHQAVLWHGPVLELARGRRPMGLAGLGPDILADPPALDAMIARLRGRPNRRGRSAMRCSTSASSPESGTCGRRSPSSTP